MITSKQIINICESWVKTVKCTPLDPYSPRTVADIYENPTSSDIVKLIKSMKENGNNSYEFKWTADNRNKKLYVWDAWNCEHYTVQRSIVHFSQKDYPNIAVGNGKIVGGNIKLTDIGPNVTANILGDNEWAWIKKYFR